MLGFYFEFKLITFIIIIDIDEFKIIILLVAFYLFNLLFVLPPSLPSLALIEFSIIYSS